MQPPTPEVAPEVARRMSIDAWIITALASLLVAASAPSIVQARRTPGEVLRLEVQTRFAGALGEVHRRWMVSHDASDEPRTIELGGRSVRVNGHGWPSIEKAHPSQDSALELIQLLLPELELGSDWQLSEHDEPGARSAIFYLDAPGGGGFMYDSSSGAILELPARVLASRS